MLMSASPMMETSENGLLISRFSIAILSGTLLGMGIGSKVPLEFGIYTILAGVIGFFYYFLTSHYSQQQHIERLRAVRESLEKRLTSHVDRPPLERNPAYSHEQILF